MPTTASSLEREISEQVGALRDVLGAQSAELASVRALLAGAARTLLVGIGSSRHVAAYGTSCLDGLLLPAPGAGIAQPAVGPGDVVIAVSQSGTTPALLAFAADAQAAGATVVSLTNAPASPLERLADLALSTGCGPESVVPATKSVTVSMLLLRGLADPLSEQAVARLADGVDELLRDDSGQVARAVASHSTPEVVVAGGFAAEAASDEVALKLAEVNGRLAVSETVVDYLHGPAAVPASVLAFLQPDDPNSAAIERRPHLLRVGTDPSYEVVVGETGDPALDAILSVVTGQYLALRWAEAAGLDPDDPRGLDKVTRTR